MSQFKVRKRPPLSHKTPGVIGAWFETKVGQFARLDAKGQGAVAHYLGMAFILASAEAHVVATTHTIEPIGPTLAAGLVLGARHILNNG